MIENIAISSDTDGNFWTERVIALDAAQSVRRNIQSTGFFEAVATAGSLFGIVAEIAFAFHSQKLPITSEKQKLIDFVSQNTAINPQMTSPLVGFHHRSITSSASPHGAPHPRAWNIADIDERDALVAFNQRSITSSASSRGAPRPRAWNIADMDQRDKILWD
jgi:hypothetical protein